MSADLQDAVVLAEDLASPSIVIELDSKGRCCGRKPLTYKRRGILFCARCAAAFGIDDHRQQANWAWVSAPGGFIPKYPRFFYPTGQVSETYAKYASILGIKKPDLLKQHYCRFIRGNTNEHDPRFTKCRCFQS